MQYTSLNHIVRSVLNQKGYTIHWYYQYMKLAADCLRELHFDTLRNIQTKKIPVTDYNAVPLPCDYVDFLKVGIISGQVVYPLTQTKGINRLNNFDSSGGIIPYGSSDEVIYERSLNYRYIDDNLYGENVGRDFGYKSNNMFDTFKILRERGEIQLSESVSADYVILEYISDGTGLTNAATKVHPYAQRAIETYIEWKGSRNRTNPVSAEAAAFYNQVRILKGRMANWTIDDIKKIIYRNKQAAGK